MRQRKRWVKFSVLLVGVVKHRSLVGGCGDVNPKWWWLVVVDWFGFTGCGGFVVGVGRLDWVWSVFGQLGLLMILALVDWIGFFLL